MTTPTASPGAPAPNFFERLRTGGFRVSNSVSLLAIYLFICIIFAALSPYFLTVDNFINIGRTLPIIGIIAIGETLVLIAGGVDLSVGSVAALAGVITGLFWEAAGFPIGVAALAGLATGALVGVINGALVTYMRINPLISTLATFSIIRGLAFVLTNAQMNQLTHPAFLYLGRGDIAGVPVPFVLMLVLYAIFIFVLRRMPFGRDLYAIGGNPMAARLAGIATRRNLMIVFILSGILGWPWRAGFGIAIGGRRTPGSGWTGIHGHRRRCLGRNEPVGRKGHIGRNTDRRHHPAHARQRSDPHRRFFVLSNCRTWRCADPGRWL